MHSLPSLVDEELLPSRSRIARFLSYLGSWRESLFRRWRHSLHGEDDPAFIQAVDQFASVVLLVGFVRRYATTPAIAETLAGLEAPTVQRLCRAIRGKLPCQLLKAVFEPNEFSSELVIPASVWKSHDDERLFEIIEQVYGANIPLSIFGEFHQLRLAYPLVDEAGVLVATKEAITHRKSKSLKRYDKGVHYTPAPLVDYLTYRTLNSAFEGLSVEQIQQLRILDPSCGCGAFLVASLRHTLLRLGSTSVQECLHVLESMIFGSDIDRQAIAWTKRILLLAVWKHCRNFDIPVPHVPDLRRNIVCADFLDPVVADDQGLSAKFNAGVDVVIGGPPFVRTRQLRKTTQYAQYKRRFRTAQSGQFDLYMLFLERTIEHLRIEGKLALSLSNTFLRTASGKLVRNFISQTCSIDEIVEFENPHIYPDASTQIALLSLTKRASQGTCRYMRIQGKTNLREKLSRLCSDQAGPVLSASAFQGSRWTFDSQQEATMISRMESVGQPLSSFQVSVSQGISTGGDKIWILKLISRDDSEEPVVENRETGRRFRVESNAIRPIFGGRDIKGYRLPNVRNVCVYPYSQNGSLLEENEFKEKFPLAYEYLVAHRRTLEKPNAPWYALGGSNSASAIRTPRLISSAVTFGRAFTLDLSGLLCKSGVISMTLNRSSYDPYALLGILNSALFWQYSQLRSPPMKEGCYQYRAKVLLNFPLVPPGREEGPLERIAELAKLLMNGDLSVTQKRDYRLLVDENVVDLYGVKEIISLTLGR